MKKTIVLIGKESVGKSQLIRSLTRKGAVSERLKGTTVAAQFYETRNFRFIDTPGIVLESDSQTTKIALKEIPNKDCIIVVATATSLDEDLEDLLPLVKNKLGMVIITHQDRVKNRINPLRLKKLKDELAVPVVNIDARDISQSEKKQIFEGCVHPKKFQVTNPQTKLKIVVTPKKDIFDIPVLGQLLSLVLLFIPAWFAVQFAIWMADNFYDTVFNTLAPVIEAINGLPAPINFLFGMDYGIVSMFPFLVLYALPTVFLFAIITSMYKTSGLIDRLTVSIHHLVIPFGLTGRDIVRVIMGFGCNVPAVISTRTSSSCTRGNCISAISFGAACSYQLPATVAVFAAAQMEFLIIPYLLVLGISTLIYLHITKTKMQKKLAKNRLLLENRDFVHWPQLRPMFAEGKSMVKEFLTIAFPIFLMICLVAGLLDWVGVLAGLTWLLAPVMLLFNLPAEAATSVVLGSIRKDGIAIGLLDSSWEGLKIPISDPVQVLTIVYLAGVLLPCLVTLYTISKEMSPRFAFKLVYRQIIAAILFSMAIAWIGYFLF